MENKYNGTEDVAVTLLFFAKSRELTECSSKEVQLPRLVTREDLISSIIDLFPSLVQIQKTLVIAVNQEYLDTGKKTELKKGDTVAIIPPLSGG